MENIIKDNIVEFVDGERKSINNIDNYDGFTNYIDIIMNNKDDKQYNDALIDIIKDYAQSKEITHTDDLFSWGKDNISAINDFMSNNAIDNYRDIETILRASSVWHKEEVLIDNSETILNYILYSKIASVVNFLGITEEQEEQFQKYIDDNIRYQELLDLSIADIEKFVNETLEIKNQNTIKRGV